ncbi:MAG: hypothetical protein ACR2MZ_00040 [Candidatus Dormibacter sp.]|uniref:hypothetical protein n=1 Tax=Candidatus Dormibacter sp. TaxID=2973982 RepID=UPI000DB5E358|nr:MAG: hypothetical protein DLM66_09340 [Candidatus Dormibacteraeota bacterium]
MTLLTAIIVGLGAGFFVGMHGKAFVIMVGVFVLVLAFQSSVLSRMPGSHIDLHDPGYWGVQPIILALGLGLTWLGARINGRRSRRSTIS